MPRPPLFATFHACAVHQNTWKMATGLEDDVDLAAFGGMKPPIRVPITLTHVQYTQGKS